MVERDSENHLKYGGIHGKIYKVLLRKSKFAIAGLLANYLTQIPIFCKIRHGLMP